MTVLKPLALNATLALAVVSGCSGASQPAGTPPAGAVIVTAANLVFDPNSVRAPAGEEFVLYFDNRESVLHNAKLVDGTGKTIVEGEVFTGPSARVLDVPALAPGTYKILCDVHPAMTAELIAVP